MSITVPSSGIPTLVHRIRKSGKPFTFFHTHRVTPELLAQAVSERRSMDLDICVDSQGRPYLGHSEEYHQKSGEPFFDSVALNTAMEAVAAAQIPVIVDCKHHDAWKSVERVVTRIGAHNCLVHSFVSEYRFAAGRPSGEPDYETEWSGINMLRDFKERFPGVTTTASAKWLPTDVLTNPEHERLLNQIRWIASQHAVDTLCLNVDDSTISDSALRFFSELGILLHVNVDCANVEALSELYVGETDELDRASNLTSFEGLQDFGH